MNEAAANRRKLLDAMGSDPDRMFRNIDLVRLTGLDKTVVGRALQALQRHGCVREAEHHGRERFFQIVMKP